MKAITIVLLLICITAVIATCPTGYAQCESGTCVANLNCCKCSYGQGFGGVNCELCMLKRDATETTQTYGKEFVTKLTF